MVSGVMTKILSNRLRFIISSNFSLLPQLHPILLLTGFPPCLTLILEVSLLCQLGLRSKRQCLPWPPSKPLGQMGCKQYFFRPYSNRGGVVGPSVTNMVKEAFLNGCIPEGINQTLRTLIPKVPTPESMSKFRPISLCNVSLKIISKVLVQRIRPLLPKLVGPTQSSFIPGRLTSDNIPYYPRNPPFNAKEER